MSAESTPAHRNRAAAPRPAIATTERAVLGATLAVALVLRATIVLRSAAQDDAYITYRYAVNLAHSLGFVYSAGERVFGTSTPLFTLGLALGARLGISPEAAAPWIGVVCDVAIGLVGWFALRTHVDRSLAWLWLVFYATFYNALQACTYGMESQLFVLLLLSAMLTFERRRFGWTGILVGLGFLVRVEAILVLPLFALESWIRDRRLGVRPLLVLAASALAIALPWIGFAIAYFGTAVPNSLTAKQFGAHATFADWTNAFLGRNAILLGLWAAFAVGAVGLLRRAQTTSRLWLGWTALYLLFMCVGRPPFYAPWYVPPMTPGLLLGAVAGCWAIAGLVRLAPRRRMAAIVIAWLALTAVTWQRQLAAVRAFKGAMQSVYIPMGDWIRDHSEPTATVFAGDIGYIGWLSERRILDAAGLVSPQVLDFYRDHAGDVAPDIEFVRATQPSFVVLSTRSPRFGRWSTPEFQALYEPVQRFQRTDPDAGRLGPDSDYTIFALRQSPPPHP